MEPQPHLFDIPTDVSYLNCASLSPQPRSVAEAGHAAVAAMSSPWRITPPDFFSGAETARSTFGRLVGGDADGVAIIPSVSYGIALAAKNLPLGPGRTVVVLEQQFPSNVYEWHALAAASGGRVVTVPRPPDHDWTSALLEHVDESTAVVDVPNCHWTDGTLVDLAAVGEAARSAGAALVVDAIQSLGARPFDVSEVRPDWLVTSVHKWMLGPYSIGFCWVAPDRRDGEPLERNWIVRAGAEDFTSLADYTDELAPGARRYDMGERANFTNLPMATAAMEQILEWGVVNIESYIGALVDEVAEGAEALGWDVAPAARRARHMVGIRRPGGIPQKLPHLLKEAGVFVSVRGSSVRISPHVYNTTEDVARLLEVLARAA